MIKIIPQWDADLCLPLKQPPRSGRSLKSAVNAAKSLPHPKAKALGYVWQVGFDKLSILCVATKTLSVDEDAYRALTRARRHRRESFSQVIKRASWDDGPKRCGDLLARATGEVSESTLQTLADAQANDLPPADKWNR